MSQKNFNTNFRLIYAISIAAFLVLMLGCADSGHIKGLVPCEGTVLLNGAPLANASVLFTPSAEGQNQRSAAAVTDTKGKYKSITGTSSTGILPGTYKVTITKSAPATEADVKRIAEIGEKLKRGEEIEDNEAIVHYKSFTGKYASPQTSDLTIEVTNKGNKQQNFNLIVENE
jgi:hypothetical protein